MNSLCCNLRLSSLQISRTLTLSSASLPQTQSSCPFPSLFLINGTLQTSLRHYAAAPTKPAVMGGLGSKKKIVKSGPTLEKKILPVETDPERLVNYLCGSCITKEGEDIKLKPDEEYPDWLWNLRTGPPPPLHELDPDTQEYWDEIKKRGLRQMRKLKKLRKF